MPTTPLSAPGAGGGAVLRGLWNQLARPTRNFMVTYLKPRKPLSHRHKSAAPPIPGSNRITEQPVSATEAVSNRN